MTKYRADFSNLFDRSLPLLLVPALIVVMFCGLSGCAKKEAAPRDLRPNIFLITMDSLRADFIGCYGNHVVRTPYWDRLSRAGWTFSEAYTHAPYTVPALASIMTSRYPVEHNARNYVKSTGQTDSKDSAQQAEIIDIPLGKDHETWAAFLKGRGYRTSAVVGGFTAGGSFSGLDNGFTAYDDKLSGITRPASDVSVRAKAEIAKEQTTPIFLWLHYFDAHFPYDAAGNGVNEYVLDDFSVSEDPGLSTENERVRKVLGEDVTRESLAALYGRYASTVTDLDRQLGMLQKEVSTSSRNRKNYWIVTADHGESFKAHGEIFDHGTFLYNTTLRVPLVIKRGKKPKASTPIQTAAVRGVDIWPTIDDFLGYSSWKKGKSGTSLKGLMTGRETSFAGEVFSETKVLDPAKDTNADNAQNIPF